MYEDILVPTDGSDTALNAAEAAIALADRFGTRLHAVNVLELGYLPPGFEDEIPEALEYYGGNAVEEVETLATDSGVEVTTDVVATDGPVHEALAGYVREHGIDCVVMGTQGRTGLRKRLLGSTTERTMRLSSVPVFAVHEDHALDADFDEILVPTDGSEGALAAADHAIDLATETGAALHVVYVVDSRSMGYDVGTVAVLEALEEAGQQAVDEIVERAEAAGVQSVQASVVTGTAAHSITGYANDHDIDCIVMGTHGRSGVNRILLGSVTERVVATADVPVLGVKAPEMVETVEAEQEE